MYSSVKTVVKQHISFTTFKEEVLKLCVCFVAGDIFRCVLHVFHRAAAEHLSPGCASLPGFSPPEDLPAGLLLRHHRNRHQPAGRPAGEWSILKVYVSTFCFHHEVLLWKCLHESSPSPESKTVCWCKFISFSNKHYPPDMAADHLKCWGNSQFAAT